MDKFDIMEAESAAGRDLRAQFEDVLDEFGRLVRKALCLDEDGVSTFAVDDEFLVHLKYLDESDTVVAFSPVGAFGGVGSPDAGEKALELLRLCELGGPTQGFALALDEDADLVLAMDRRTVLEISSVDALAAWIEALIGAVRAVRDDFANRFPAREV